MFELFFLLIFFSSFRRVLVDSAYFLLEFWPLALNSVRIRCIVRVGKLSRNLREKARKNFNHRPDLHAFTVTTTNDGNDDAAKAYQSALDTKTTIRHKCKTKRTSGKSRRKRIIYINKESNFGSNPIMVALSWEET